MLGHVPMRTPLQKSSFHQAMPLGMQLHGIGGGFSPRLLVMKHKYRSEHVVSRGHALPASSSPYAGTTSFSTGNRQKGTRHVSSY